MRVFKKRKNCVSQSVKIPIEIFIENTFISGLTNNKITGGVNRCGGD